LTRASIAGTKRWLRAKQPSASIRYDGGGMGKGGTGTLLVNDAQVAQGRIEHTQPMMFSADETADVGSTSAHQSSKPSARTPSRASMDTFAWTVEVRAP